jgi:hypothetical protein
MPQVPTVRQLARSAALGAALLVAPVLSGCETPEATLANIPENLVVDPFLWQGAMDVLSGILPIAVADPATGRIETGWGNISGRAGEEVKAIVQIYPGELSANSVAVEGFRRMNGVPAPLRAGAAAEVQEAILLRARQLRASIDN